VIASPLKLATPLTAFTTAVPVSAPLPGFVPIAIVIAWLADVTRFPSASRTVTWMAGEIAVPIIAAVGCTVKASALAAPGLMLKFPLVAPVSPVALATRV
jgi:hypothetical protein